MDRLTLIGQMGAGKSTVARLLAERWRARGFVAVDLDAVVVARAGSTIPELFATLGEAGFRRLEREALDALLGAERGAGGPRRAIVATGGGAPCGPGAMDVILAAGPCVWLDAAPEVLAARAMAAGGRPLLEGLDLEAARDLFREQRVARAPSYTRAHHVVDATGPPEAVVDAIALLVSPDAPWP